MVISTLCFLLCEFKIKHITDVFQYIPMYFHQFTPTQEESQIISWIQENGRRVHILNLVGCTNTTDATLRAIASHCPRLITIYLHQCHQISDTGIIVLVRACSRLSKIHLNQCSGLTDRTVIAITHNCPELIGLFLAQCHQITDASISSLANGCPDLLNLDLTDCPKVRSSTVDRIVSRLPECRVVGVVPETTESYLSTGWKWLSEIFVE